MNIKVTAFTVTQKLFNSNNQRFQEPLGDCFKTKLGILGGMEDIEYIMAVRVYYGLGKHNVFKGKC